MRPRISPIHLCLLVLFGCDFEQGRDLADSFEPVIEVGDRRVALAGTFVDATSGEFVESAVTLTFAGQGGTLVEDLFGRPVDSMVARDGAVSFSLSNVVNPSPAEPVELRLLATAAGYRPNAVRLSVSSLGWQEFRFLLERDGDPLAARVTAGGTLDAAGGSLSAAAEVVAVDLGQPVARLGFQGGTRFLDGAGDSIDGSVDVQLDWVPPSEAAIATFPGGLDAGTRVPGRRREASSQTTAGLADIRGFTEDGLSVREFDGTVHLEVLVDASVRNPGTNATVQAGDLIEFYRWLPDSGFWELSGEVTLMQRSSRLSATVAISRPGTYSVGYRTKHCSPGRLQVSGNLAGGYLVAYRGTPADADGIRLWRYRPRETDVALDAPPDFWRGIVRVFHGESYVEVPYDGLCGRTFEVALPPAAAEIDEYVALDPDPCTALRVTALPTLAVLVRKDPRGSGGLGAWLSGPFLFGAPTPERDALGRLTRLTAAGPATVGTTTIVLGEKAWSHPGVAAGSVLGFSQPAEELGLCVMN